MTGFPRTVSTPLIALVVLITAFATYAPSAHAGTIYTVPTDRMVGCTNAKLDDRGSGQIDAAGNLYVPCRYIDGVERPNIRVYNAANHLVRTIIVPAFPAGDRYANDVAPNADGSILYVAQRSTYTFHKLVRQDDGSYVRDVNWVLGTFADPVAGVTRPKGEYISSDADGNLYVANGLWVGGPYAFLKYAPDGKLITRFGQYKYLSWAAGDIYHQPGGLAATLDGTSVYTSEVGNNRVQRWDLRFDGSYAPAAQWGSTEASDPKRWGSCMSLTQMAAPYDVSVDAAGYAYAVNATCGKLGVERTEVHRMRGNQIDLIVSPKLKDQYSYQHAIAVAADGTIYIPSVSAIMRAPGADTAPIEVPVDATEPELASVTIPATTAVRNVRVTLAATDAVGVTQMRVVEGDVDIATGAWRAYAAAFDHEFAAGDGVKRIKVQVRDAAGNLSAVLQAQTTLTTPIVVPDPQPEQPQQPGVNAAPVLNQVTVPNPAAYRQVTIAIDATDDVAVTQMRLADDYGNWGDWKPFAAATEFVLRAGAGNRGIFVQVRDAQGLTSGSLYRTTVSSGIDKPAQQPDPEPQPQPDPLPDPNPNPNPNPNPDPNPIPNPDVVDTAPVLRAMTIPAQTTTRDIVVTIDAIDERAVTQMRLATETGIWGPWQPFAATTTFALTAGLGPRGVSVQVRDAKLQESGTLYRATKLVAGEPAPNPQPDPQPQPNPDPPAPNPNPNPNPNPVPNPPVPVVDAAAPVLRAVTLPATTTTRAVIVAIDATDDVAVTEVRLANEDGNWGAWQPFAANTAWVLTKVAMTKGVFVQVRDAARRESKALYRTTLCAAPCADPAGALRAKATPLEIKARAITVNLRRGSMRADRVRASAKSEHFDVSQADGRRDVIDCGAGRDTVLRRPEDVTRNCEVVRIVRDPR